MTEPTAPDSLLALARQGRVPDGLTAAGRQARFGDLKDVVPARGQLWRAAWDDTSVLVLLLDASSTEVSVAPLTIEPSAEDEHSFVLMPTASALGVAATVWMGLRTTLPTRVLDSVIDRLADELVDDLELSEARHGRRGELLFRSGESIQSEFDTAVEARAEIADDLDFLRAAPALPTQHEGQRTPTLADLLKGRVDLPALKAALQPFGLSQSAVMEILRGSKPISLDYVPTIAKTTGLTPEVVSKAVRPLPPDLAAEAERPRYRQAWRELAQRESVDETTARLQGAYGAFALAARQTGASSPRWAERLDQYLLSRQLRSQ